MVGTESLPLPANTVLSRILARSNQYLNSCPQSTRSPLAATCHIRVNLPDPPALFPALVAAGARLEVAQAMQAAYHRRACEFREQALTTISRACSKLAQIPSSSSHASDEAIIATFQQTYLKKLNTWISEAVALLQEKGPPILCCHKGSKRATAKISKTFNHQYVPLLEHFFEENPFPTHADKVFLSRKSGMTYRQIHVWFQNRRNRTKKPLHKKPVAEGATIPLDTLIDKMGNFVVPPATKSDTPSSRSTLASPSNETFNVLDGVAPPHAFPTAYPPSCGYDPFPGTPAFASSEWPRRPAFSSGRPRQSVVDVDELTEKLSRLNVWDDSLSRLRRKAGKVTCDGFTAMSAFTVRPYPAPHPASIRTAVVPAPRRVIFQPVRAPASSLHTFRSPSPNSPMVTLVPTLARQRKVAPLPKRVPPGLSFTSDREISGSSTNSQSRTLSSRSSSPGSEVSVDDSRHTHYWTSNSSSPVTTPETPSPLALPT